MLLIGLPHHLVQGIRGLYKTIIIIYSINKTHLNELGGRQDCCVSPKLYSVTYISVCETTCHKRVEKTPKDSEIKLSTFMDVILFVDNKVISPIF